MYSSCKEEETFDLDSLGPFAPEILSGYKLSRNEYFLVIARLVPENNIDEIIKSFNSYIGRKKLVIVGAIENTSYVKKLKSLSNEKIIFMDAIFNKKILSEALCVELLDTSGIAKRFRCL